MVLKSGECLKIEEFRTEFKRVTYIYLKTTTHSK